MKILVPTDGSAHARAAIAEAAELAVSTKSEVTVVTVSEVLTLPPTSMLATPAYPPGHHVPPTYQAPSDEEAWAVLDDAAAAFRQRGIEPALIHKLGDPAEMILLTAQESDTDLIVMGSHGRKGIMRFLLGSISDKVMRYATCSVLISRRKWAS